MKVYIIECRVRGAIGMFSPRQFTASSIESALEQAQDLGFETRFLIRII